jgi:hypothetical protein
MSGTTLDTGYQVDGGAGGDDSENATQAQVIAVQTVDESAQGIVTNEGTVQNSFVFSYNGVTITYTMFQQIIADANLYAALNASSVASANITWND